MALDGLGGALLALATWGLVAAVLLAALTPLPLPPATRLRLARLVALLASLATAAVGAIGLAGAQPPPLEWWPGLPGEPFSLACDALSAPFLLLLGLVGAASFACAHDDASAAPNGRSARLALHAGLALGLLGVFASRNGLLFLMAWEASTLCTAALVASETRSGRARSAAYVLLALSHLGLALVAFALLRLASLSGSFQFDALAETLASLPAREAALLTWTFTLGFAVKLGLVPLHVWLPAAHAEAPGPVSALLSGVVVKAGLYGMLRFAWQMPGAPPEHWGVVLLIAGTVTALTGALYAAVESDAKRLLAYSTIKNAGVLAIATGLAALLAAGGPREIAGVALAAVFVHAIGHGLSKALAFLSVSEAVRAAGSHSLEALGGLAVRLPRVSLAALVATLSLCTLPPLACFPGEWLVIQALILGDSGGAGALGLLAPFAGAGLVLATALTVAAMVKLYGIGFLGRPRSAGAEQARPLSPGSESALLAFALLPIAWGLGAPWAAGALHAPLAAVLGGFDTSSLIGADGLALVPASDTAASASPAVVALLIAVFAVVAAAWIRARSGRRDVRRAPAWSGGVPLEPRMQYSALGFTKPIRIVFASILRSERELEVTEQGSPYFGRRLRYRSNVPPLFERVVYRPFVMAVLAGSEQIRRLQAGSLHLYLAYLLAALVALLLWARA